VIKVGKAANDNVVLRRLHGGVQLKVTHGEFLVGRYTNGVALAVFSGMQRTGIGLSHQEAQALASALQNAFNDRGH
jgi:hypothetical protein